MIKSITILFLLLVFSKNAFCQIGRDRESDFLNMRKVVVAIGTLTTDSNIVNGHKVAIPKFSVIGSGLMSYVKIDTFVVNAVVTAGHVIKYFKDHNLPSLYIRPSWADTVDVTEYLGIEVFLTNEDKTSNIFLYPGNQIDLGAIIVSPVAITRDRVFSENIQKNHNPLFPVRSMTLPYLGSEVWVCGYPGHIENQFTTYFRYAISTFKPGLVTWKPSVNMTNNQLNHIALIESNASYGNSGGPVFALSENIELVGILTGGYEDTNPVYINGKAVIDPVSRQPVFTKSRAGVSIIERAEYVRRLLDYVNRQIKVVLNKK